MPTLDELREAYERENYHEDGAFSYDDMNAFHRKARAYIDALEAERTAQQQRIEKLEAALEPFAVRYPTEHMDLMPDLDKWTPVYQWVDKPSELLPGTPVIYIGEFRDVNAVYPYTPSWRKPDDADDDRRE